MLTLTKKSVLLYFLCVCQPIRSYNIVVVFVLHGGHNLLDVGEDVLLAPLHVDGLHLVAVLGHQGRRLLLERRDPLAAKFGQIRSNFGCIRTERVSLDGGEVVVKVARGDEPVLEHVVLGLEEEDGVGRADVRLERRRLRRVDREAVDQEAL